MPGAGEAVGRAAVWVRRNSALVYGARRKRLRSVNGAAGIRHGCNEEDCQLLTRLAGWPEKCRAKVRIPEPPGVSVAQTKDELETAFLTMHREPLMAIRAPSLTKAQGRNFFIYLQSRLTQNTNAEIT